MSRIKGAFGVLPTRRRFEKIKDPMFDNVWRAIDE